MERKFVEPLFFVALLIGTLVVVFMLFRPFLYTLTLAGILAYLTHSAYTLVARALRSPSWAAAVMTVLVFVALLLPLTVIGLRIVYEASDLYVSLSAGATQERFDDAVVRVQGFLDGALPGVRIDGQRITERLGSTLSIVVTSLGSLLGSFASLVMSFFLLLLFYYYLVRDGAHLVERFKELSPLSSTREDEVLSRVGRAVTVTVRGSLVMALLQGLVSGLGYILFGLPSPALWGSVVVFAAFIPTVGTALIQIPAVLFLLFTGHPAQALGLALWAALAVGMLDNVLGPKLMSRGTHMHPLITLLAILGGIGFYGPLGILLGPITVALLHALLDIYRSVIGEHASGHTLTRHAARGV